MRELNSYPVSLDMDSANDAEDEMLQEAIRLSLLPDEVANNDVDALQPEFQSLALPATSERRFHRNITRLHTIVNTHSGLGMKVSGSHDFRGPLSGNFSYEPLQSSGDFRLVRLVNDEHERARGIDFDLMTFNLDSTELPSYITLSYSWGKTYADGSHLTHTAVCNGQALRVTTTVYQALSRIRKIGGWQNFGSSIFLWIDGICINQQDVKERQNQVGRMADIYARCWRMFVWLGEHGKDVPRWFSPLGTINKFLDHYHRSNEDEMRIVDMADTRQGRHSTICDPCVCQDAGLSRRCF